MSRVTESDERALIEAAQKDPGRFAELYEQNFHRVYAYVACRVHDRSERQDITAHVFQQALANIGKFKWRGAPFITWLYRIAANAIADQARKKSREVTETEGATNTSVDSDLEQAVTALLAEREPVVNETDRELAELVAVARELRGLPSEQFRAALTEQLGGKDEMSTAAKSKSFKREGFRTVTPYLMARPAVELVEFVKQAFGAVESYRFGGAEGLHCEVNIGDSKVLIVGSPTIEPRPAAIHLYVSDVDEVYERAVAAGATSLAAPSDQEYGERIAAVKDIGGNEWYIAKRFDSTPIQDLHNVTVYFHPVGAPKFIDFLENAFGSELVERHQSNEGFVYHAKVRLGDSIVEMGEAHDQWQPMPSAIYLYVEDVDTTYKQALSAGATSALEPTNQPYGDRTAWVNDGFGNVWYLATWQG